MELLTEIAKQIKVLYLIEESQIGEVSCDMLYIHWGGEPRVGGTIVALSKRKEKIKKVDQCRTWTDDFRVWNPMLYQLS